MTLGVEDLAGPLDNWVLAAPREIDPATGLVAGANVLRRGVGMAVHPGRGAGRGLGPRHRGLRRAARRHGHRADRAGGDHAGPRRAARLPTAPADRCSTGWLTWACAACCTCSATTRGCRRSWSVN